MNSYVISHALRNETILKSLGPSVRPQGGKWGNLLNASNFFLVGFSKKPIADLNSAARVQP